MRGWLIAAALMAALLDAGAAFAQNPGADCIVADSRFRNGRLRENIPPLQVCTKADVAMWLRVRAHMELVSTYEKLKDTDGLIDELKVLTAPPFLDDPLFNTPPEPLKDGLTDSLPAAKYAGASQVLLLAHLANAYLEKKQYQEAADAAATAIRQSHKVPADVLDDEAEAWLARAYALQGLNKMDQMMPALIRAYVRGIDRPSVTAVISGQSAATQATLKALRDKMVKNGHAVGRWDAQQAALGKPFDPAAPEIAAALKAVQEVQAEEVAIVGPSGLD